MHRSRTIPTWLKAWLLSTAAAVAAPEESKVPPIAVIFDRSAEALPRTEIRQAIATELERPVVTAWDGRIAVIEISLLEDGKVRIRYRPPEGELERVLEIADRPTEVPAIVGLAAENLVVDPLPGVVEPLDAGGPAQAGRAPPPPPPSPAPTSVARTLAPVAFVPPDRTLSVLPRLGFLGVISGGELTGSSDASLGLALRLELPVTPWLRLGTEVGVLNFSSGTLSDGLGRFAETSATLADVSIVPKLTIARLGPRTELALEGFVGVVVPLRVDGEGMASNETGGGKHRYNGEAGFRLGAALAITHWLSQNFALSLAAGLDHRFFVATNSTASAADELAIDRDVVKVWHTAPYVQLGLTSRF